MTSTNRKVVVAFLPAIAIHLGFVAALGILFGLVESERLDVLPVMLMASPAPGIVPATTPRAPALAVEPNKKVAPSKTKKRIAPPVPASAGSETDLTATVVAEAEPAITAVVPQPEAVPTPTPVTVVEPEPPAEPVVDLKTRLAQIRSKIQKSLVYPPMAKLKGIEGTATVRFDVDDSGQPINVKIASSSGFDILDQAAKKTVEAAAPYPLVDPTVKVPVVFELK